MKLHIRAILLFSLSFTLMLATAPAHSGDKVFNGGDSNELIFKEVANNIAEWITSGNADEMDQWLPPSISLQVYKTKMLSALSNFHIGFTLEKVIVGGAEKTCANSKDEKGQNQIICNIARFTDLHKNDIGGLYQIVHHEFAGLSGLETNSGQDSDYSLSSHISAYLEEETMERLPVNKNINPKNTAEVRLLCGPRQIKNGAIEIYQSGQSTSIPSLGGSQWSVEINCQDDPKGSLTLYKISQNLAHKTKSCISVDIGDLENGACIRTQFARFILASNLECQNYQNLARYSGSQTPIALTIATDTGKLKSLSYTKYHKGEYLCQ